jgi:hypothetical protein
MNTGSTIFAQIFKFVDRYQFSLCVARHNGDYKIRSFSCWEHFLTLSFAQLTYRESLRDIEACLSAVQPKLHNSGIQTKISRSTLADANENRSWRIYADFANVLIGRARELYCKDKHFNLDLDALVFAFDSSTIDLCLNLFPWAKFRKNKGGIKMHTLLDIKGSIPVWIAITDALCHDVNMMDALPLEPGAYYIMDRGYMDFERLYRFQSNGAFFVTRAKKNLQFRRLEGRKVDKGLGLICDQTIVLAQEKSFEGYPARLRRISYRDPATAKKFVFLTNNFQLDAIVIAQLYKERWKVELFFKWIKQHLRIKAFYGTSLNAVCTQIWVAVAIYVLIAIVRKELKTEKSLYAILQVLSISLFEKAPLYQILNEISEIKQSENFSKQLKMFDL